MAARKNRFPSEADTAPGASSSQSPVGRTSGPAPRGKRERSEAPTLPPPKSKRSKTPPAEPRSASKSRRSRHPDSAHAEVDEVVADLTRDPRRERE